MSHILSLFMAFFLKKKQKTFLDVNYINGVLTPLCQCPPSFFRTVSAHSLEETRRSVFSKVLIWQCIIFIFITKYLSGKTLGSLSHFRIVKALLNFRSMRIKRNIRLLHVLHYYCYSIKEH